MKENPLKKLLVLDASRLVPGPFCSLILSDLGARVIKIEDSQKGDYLRSIPPFDVEGESCYFKALNRNKESLVVNLKSKQGIQILKKLIRKCDVFIESYRPQVIKSVGLSFSSVKKINPKIIYVSITGFGQNGKRSHLAGHDLNYLSLSGGLDGKNLPGIQWSDFVGGGLWAAFNILIQLIVKKRKAVHLDIAMTDAITFLGMMKLINAQSGQQKSVLNGLLARYQIYETKDEKKVALAALESKFWNQFCELTDNSEWKDNSQQQYFDFNMEVHQKLSDTFKQKTRSEWEKWAEKYDLCLTPVLEDKEILKDDSFLHRGYWFEDKNVVYPTTPINKIKLRFKKPPHYGQHSKKILKEIGFKSNEIQSFLKNEIIK